jgi:hypothetical protein
VATLDLIGTFGGCGMYVRGGFSYSCPALKLVGYRDDLDLRRAMLGTQRDGMSQV